MVEEKEKEAETVDGLFEETDHEFSFEEGEPTHSDPQFPNETSSLTTLVTAGKPHKKIVLSLAVVVFLLLTLFLAVRYRAKINFSSTAPAIQTAITPSALAPAQKIIAPESQASLSKEPPAALGLGAEGAEPRHNTATLSPIPTGLSVPAADLEKELFTPPGPHSTEVHPNTALALDPAMLTRLTQGLDALERLNQQMETNLTQIKYLEAYTREIGQTITNLNAAINGMDGRLLALTQTAYALSKDVGSVRHEVGTVKNALGDEGLDWEPVRPAPSQRTVAAPSHGQVAEGYSLHAVIPGRAWIKTASGQIITVTEGESIGDYGKVLVIDAAKGRVLTSSGVTFK